MTQVCIISEQVAMQIVGQEYADGQLYYPVQLPDGRWYIGVAEAVALGGCLEVVDLDVLLHVPEDGGSATD